MGVVITELTRSPTLELVRDIRPKFPQDYRDPFQPAALTGADINAFLLRECGRVSAGSAKGRVAELRSILRFLYLRGITSAPLGTAVPPVGGWRFATLPPPTMTATDVQRLLDSCDRGSPVGIRNFAIMTLIAWLGLRSIEVARLELRDVDWRAGELVVRGKGRRHDRLPLPAEVGEALVAYLSGGRNPEGARHLFLTCRAPRGPIRADLVGDVVERACTRAGLPIVGPHRLRHALASELQVSGVASTASFGKIRELPLPVTSPFGLDHGRLVGPRHTHPDQEIDPAVALNTTMLHPVRLHPVPDSWI